MKYNKEFTGNKYREIAKALNIKDAESRSIEDIRDAACEAIDALSKKSWHPCDDLRTRCQRSGYRKNC